MSKIRKVTIMVLAILALVFIQLGAVACIPKPNQTSMFADANATAFVLTKDYTLSEIDVEATGGTSRKVVLDKACSFNLSGKVLNLNGYTLEINSYVKDCLVSFKNGGIINGRLEISVPNGDVEFNGATIANTVAYELEAASSTIKFSNAKCLGKGVVKSETRIQIDFSEMGDIELAGSGKLEAGEGATLGKVSVGTNASGATISISQKAIVAAMAISAKAQINIAGTVENVTVNENATNASEIKVKVEQSAKVDNVEIKAPAKVDVKGEVKNVTVAESANSSEGNVEVKVASTASVQQMDLKAKADVEVKGSIGNVVVGETATGTNVTVKGEDAAVGRVVVSEDVDAGVEINGVEKEVVSNEQINKTHNYEQTSLVDSTCSTTGKATYTCRECGDSYDAPIAKKAHEYQVSITKHPTQLSAGERTYQCKNCPANYVEHIAALELQSKSISALIGLLIGDGSYTLTIDEDSKFIACTEITGSANRFGEKTFAVFEVAEASLTVTEGSPKGSLKFKLCMITVEFDGNGTFDALDYSDKDYEQVIELYAYLDGESIIYELVDIDANHGSLNMNMVTDAWLNLITRGQLTTQDLFEIIEGAKKVQTLMESYKQALKQSVETDGGLESLFALLGQNIIKEELDEEYTVYSLSYELLDDLGDILIEKTIFDIIEEKGGEGAFDSLVASIKALPLLTVKDITNYAITIEENYGIKIDDTFALIEEFVKNEIGVEIDIREELEKNYDLSLLDIIFDMVSNNAAMDTPVQGGVNNKFDAQSPEFTKENLKLQIDQMIDGYAVYAKEYTLDQIFNLIMYENPDKAIIGYDPETYQPIYSEEDFSAGTFLKGMAIQLDESMNCYVTFDADGKLVSISTNLMGSVTASYMVEEEVYVVNASVQLPASETSDAMLYAIQFTYAPNTEILSVNVTANGQDMYSASVQLNGDEFDFKLLVEQVDTMIAEIIANIDKTDANVIFNGVMSVMGYQVMLDADKETGKASLIVSQQTSEMVKATLATDENGVVTLDVFFMQAPLATFVIDGDSIEDFEAETTVNIMEQSVKVAVKVETIDSGIYKVTVDVDMPMFGATNKEDASAPLQPMNEQDITDNEEPKEERAITKLELIITVTETSSEKMVAVDILLTTNEETYFDGDELILVDGTVTYKVYKDGNGETEKVQIISDFNRIFAGMYGIANDGSLMGGTSEQHLNYAQYYLDIIVDVKNDLVADEEDFNGIKDSLNKISKIVYDDGETVLNYVKNNDTEYYELVRTMESFYNQYEENDLYYGVLETTTYNAVIPAKNGIPTVGIFNTKKDCGDWVYFYFASYVTFDIDVEYKYGLFSYEDGKYTISELDYIENSSRKFSEHTELKGYFNEKTNGTAISSQHDYEYDCVRKGEYCHEGIYITRTCSTCNDKDEFYRDSCYYVTEGQVFNTPCGRSEIEIKYCVGCNEYWDNVGDICCDFYDDYIYDGSSRRDMTTTDFIELGLSSQGFHSGTVHAYSCEWCGAQKFAYDWYSYDAQNDRCYKNYYNYYEFAGQGSYKASSAYTYHKYESCYSPTHGYSGDVNETAIKQELSGYVDAKYLNAAIYGDISINKCLMCGEKNWIRFELFDDNGYLLQGDIDFVDDVYAGSNLRYYDRDYVLSKIGNYYNGEVVGYEHEEQLNKNKQVIFVWMKLDYSDGSYVDYHNSVNSNTEVEIYNRNTCLSTYITLNVNGEEIYRETREHHDYQTYMEGGVCCTESDAYFVNKCTVCSKTDGDNEYVNYHSWHSYGCSFKHISESELDNVFDIQKGWYCGYCNKAQHVSLVLTNDWTLTEDVYIYAEGLEINLNENTIDLNGYNLIIYSLNGAGAVIYNGEITDSAIEDAGYLVMFTDSSEWGRYDDKYGEKQTLGFGENFVIECDFFISECDNRNTIAQSFYNQYEVQLEGLHDLT